MRLMPAVLLLFLCVSGAGAAQPVWAGEDPAPAEYQTEGGWGRLTVQRAGPASLKFRLRAQGANGHTCGLDGEILAGVGSLTPEGMREVCRVFFKPVAGGVEVSSTGGQACRSFCGMRASFEGTYLRASAACAEPARREARREFKKLYDAGDYARAQAALRPVLADCGASMPWLEAGWIRNDLALTQFKLGDPQGCLLTLQPLRADGARSDSDIRAAYPPSDADRYLSILRATRSNAGRCEAAPAL